MTTVLQNSKNPCQQKMRKELEGKYLISILFNNKIFGYKNI